MDELAPRLRELGRAVADVSDRGADRGTLDAARRRWLAPGPSGTGARRRAVVAAVALAGALCIALGTGAALRGGAGPEVSFEVGSPPTRGAVGDWIAAAPDATLGVRFSEGSQLMLSPSARVRVTDTTERGASILIERGQVRAAVVHTGAETRWAVVAGPFAVRVVGTAFDAAWDPSTERFDLTMHEGSTVVTGPLLDSGRTLVAGERLGVSVRQGRLEVTVGDPAAPTRSVAEEPPAAAPAEPGAAETATASAVAPPPAPPPAPPWRELAAAGRYREALAEVDRTGFSRELEQASAGELMLLADAARFGARPSDAREALLAARRRFGARGRSAFLLGKIAADQQGSPADAAQWFETYLREEPNGPLAEQALGRLVELHKGNPALARSTAEKYLASFPNGPHAALARTLVSP